METEMNLIQSLAFIQSELKAPKDKTNSFGGYKYRSCESILEALKPLLKAVGAVLVLSDEPVELCGSVYIKATATFIKGDERCEVTAFAKEDAHKGMSAEQCTGSASSYAHKYAVGGLFLVDDAQDPDTMPPKTPAKAAGTPSKAASSSRKANTQPKRKTPKQRFWEACLKACQGSKDDAEAMSMRMLDQLGHEPTDDDFEALAFSVESSMSDE